MAVYDPESKKLIVRVVYDGPGMAGKTTNLQQICTTFTPDRRSDLYSGMTAASRTLCLDWMQLDGGLVRGHDLRCHLLTVPGQAVLNRRRQMLLSMADTVVFVLDSSEDGVREAFPMWRSLLACTGGPAAGVPVLIQANKQDRPGALSITELRERWSLDPSIPIVAANAASGQGVRETVVLAIRAAAVLLQDDLTTTGIAELEGTYETGQQLEQRIMAAERAHQVSPFDALRAATPHPPSVHTSLNEAPALQAHAPETPVTGAPPSGAPLSGAPAARAPSAPASATSEAPAFGAPASIAPSSASDAPLKPVTLPTADVPLGLVWPAVEGRKTLRRVPFSEAVRHHVKHASGRRGRARHSDVIIFEAGIWCLKTSSNRRFSSADEARNELVRLAHTKLELGTLCVPRTVLVAQHDLDGTYSVWTISLWLTTLTSQLEYATKHHDEGTLSDVLSEYARLVVRGLRMCLDSNLILDLDPSNFGIFCDEAFYLDDELPHGVEIPLAGHAILRRFDEYANHPGALRVYLEVLLHELELHLRAGEAEQLNLHHAIAKTIVSTDSGKRAKDLLSSALEAPRKAVR